MFYADSTSFPFMAANAFSRLPNRRSASWRPGLANQQGVPLHNEVFVSSRDGAGAAAALALALDGWYSTQTETGHTAYPGAFLWVQTRDAARLSGKPYRAGLPEILRGRVIHVLADKAEDALFALEEGLRCCELSFVIGELSGNPKTLDFTASRRLSLVSKRYGVPLFLVRLDACRDLSSARMRWDVASAPSSASLYDAYAPGLPAWQCELFRSRQYPPGKWILQETQGKLRMQQKPRATNDTVAGIDWTAGLRRKRLQQRA